MPKPNKDQFLLQPNFSHLILDGFVTIPNQDFFASRHLKRYPFSPGLKLMKRAILSVDPILIQSHENMQ